LPTSRIAPSLHHALLPLGEFGRTLDHLRQAEPLAEALGDTRRLVMLARYRASCVTNLGDPDGSLAAAQRALALAATLEDVSLRIGATNALADVYWLLSDYRRSTEAFRQTLEGMYDAPPQERFGTSAILSVYVRAHLARCLAELGAFGEGRGYGAEALRRAETFAHPYSLAQACAAVGLCYLRLQNAWRLYQAVADAALAVVRCQQAQLWELRVALGLSCLWQQRGQRGPCRTLVFGRLASQLI
jgi:hypothetical protein